MPYTPTVWTDNVTLVSATLLNKIETGIVSLSAPAPSTTPPASPADGDLWYLPADPVNGVTWQFRYNASGGTYKWEFVGGAPLRSDVQTNETTASTTYVELTTTQRIVLPRAGDYDAVYGAGAAANSTATAQTNITLLDGAQSFGSSSFISATASAIGALNRAVRVTGRAAGATLTLKFCVTYAGSGNFAERYLEVRPVRVS